MATRAERAIGRTLVPLLPPEGPLAPAGAGVRLHPDHLVGSTSDEPVTRARQLPGEDQVHVAFGAGVAFPGFQVDFGVDLANRANAFSLSAIDSF